MKRTKRILSLLLALVMVLSLCPVTLLASAKEPSYEVVSELAELTEGRYVITLWRYIGQSNAEGVLLHSENNNSLHASKNEDYSLLTNEELPLTALWDIAPAEGGYTIQNASTGKYLGDAIPADSDTPVVHRIVEGTCNSVHNYAIANSAGTGSLRYSNSSGQFSFNTTAPETEVARAYACNVILYRVVTPVPTNIAPKAVASTTTCASWNNVAGVNDGQVPTVSQGNQAGAYGSWGQNTACDPEIITLTWSAPVELEGAGVFFWHDDGKENRSGIDFPVSYTFEYLTEDGETWAVVPDPVGLEVNEDVMNRSSFGAITTTALRLVMEKETASGTYGLGVAEIEAYGWLTELDTNALEAAIAAAEALTDLSNYTDESAAALTEALAAAKAVLENPTDQEAIDAAAAALNAALNGLVIKPVEKPEQENIAPQGTASASYCASWNNVAGVNDGEVPAQSTGNQAGAYGSWGQNNNAAPEPIVITFAETVTIYGTGMYFWHDDGMNNRNGIDFPASYSFEYLQADGETWAPVTGARGMNNAPDEMNYTVFSHVSTTALRVLLQKSATGSFGLGVAEFEIYGVFGEAPAEPVQFFAGSDLQSSSSQGVNWDKYLADIAAAAHNAGHEIDVSFWCGDYADGSVYSDGSDTSATETPQRIQYIKDTLGAHWTDVEYFFAQGNHDGSQHIGTVLDETGPKEHDDFVLYQINEDDFPWWQAGYSTYSSEDTCLEKINATTETLAAYLDGLIAAGDQRVIFIYTHVPLHWTSRSTTMNSWWSDNIHADILFNMINEKAEDLDIVFLYGHNHSENYADAYPAGGTVNFFAPGDEIRIPNGQVAASGNYTEEIIKFTYLNAGYVGATATGFSPSVATASVITLTPETVEFTRYNATGKQEGSDRTLIRNNRGEYPAYLQLSSVENPKVRSEGDTEHFKAVLKNAEAASYAWSVEGCGEVSDGQDTDTAAITYNGGGDAVVKVTVTYTDSAEQTQTLEQTMTVTVKAAPAPDPNAITYNEVTSVAELAEGKDYVIVAWRYFGQGSDEALNGYVFQAENNGSLRAPTTDDYATISPENEIPDAALWHIVPVEGGITLQNVGTGKYLGTAIPAAADEPYTLTIAEGECSGVYNMAIGTASGSIRYSNSSGTFSYSTTAPAAEVVRAYAANLTIYEKVSPKVYANIAPQASGVTAPYCASWNNLGGVNDGVLPSASNTAGDNTAYGSWRSNATADPELITFTFAKPAEIVGAGAYFVYNENSPHEQYGVDFPDSYTFEYLNDAGEWVEGPSAQGYGLEEDIVNQTSFGKVSTTGFRIVMQRQAGTFGLGVGEIEIYGEFVTLDTSALEAAIARAEAQDESLWTPESWAAMQEALAAAKSTLENAVSQAALDAAAEALEAAIDALEELTPDYVDKAALREAIAQAEAQTESLWTPESWAAMQEALAAAKAVEADEAATQEQVDAATEALLAAVAALVDKVQAVIDQIEALPEPFTLDDEDALFAARNAYEALTEEEKARVTNYTDLLLTEIEYFKLLAQKAFFDTVQTSIETLREYEAHAEQNHDAEHQAAARAALEQAIARLQDAQSSEELRAIVDAAIKAIDEALKGGELQPGGDNPPDEPPDNPPDNPPDEPEEPEEPIDPFFVDVQDPKAPYYNAVYWAVAHKPYQITAGLDATHFGPNNTVTRAQAMVFLWAAKDRPKFKTASTQFTDVKKSDWFYKAVMWAVENGVTSGTDATHFSPNKTCSRGEILGFLYAAMKKPKVKISNPYSDVTTQWYKKAALWAYEKGIEKGEKGKFNASTPCTRGAIVLYLYRFLTGKDLAK